MESAALTLTVTQRVLQRRSDPSTVQGLHDTVWVWRREFQLERFCTATILASLPQFVLILSKTER